MILTALVIWVLLFFFRSEVIRATEDDSFFIRVSGRSLLTTLCFGIGGIGGDGFGVPGPIIFALIFFNGPRAYVYTAIIPFVFWFFFFAIFHTMGYFVKKREENEQSE